MRADKTVSCALKLFGTSIILGISITLLQVSLALSDQLRTNPSSGSPVMANYSSIKSKENDLFESPKKFELYVKDKYKEIREAASRVRQTPHGPVGEISIRGNIVPQKKPAIDLAAEPDRHARARAIAKAFMEDEPALLGIIQPEEIREFRINTGKGFGGDHTVIHYKRYINYIELQDANITITIGPEENIQNIRVSLVPVPPEVYEATNMKTLSDKEIMSFIEADLAEFDERGIDMNNINKSFKKVATNKYPYVLWKVSYIFDYTIDAFTGKILTKESGILPPFKIRQRPAMRNPDGIKP